jgi:ubiquinone biosynthesis protein
LGKRSAAFGVTLRILRIGLAFVAFFVVPAIGVGPYRHLPQHVRLRLLLQHLGGAWIKIGQALALRFDLLPREYCSELLKLLSENPAIDYALVRQVIQEDFGEPPETLFAFFEPLPLATASVAQVHVAKTSSGLLLAVKVQRPDAPRRFEADFSVLRIIVNLIGIFDAFGGLSLRAFVNEFERYTREELDFVNEARSGYRLWLNSRNDPLQVCAQIHFEFCSKRVIAMEMLHGKPLLAFIESAREQPRDPDVSASRNREIKLISHNLFWCMCNQIFRDGFFHADPHPANIFVLAENRIGFVDFGATGRLPADVRLRFIRHVIYLYRGDFEQAVKEILRILIPTQDTDLRMIRRDLVLAFEHYRYSASDKNANRRELTRELFINTMSIARRNRVLMPQTMALYYKSILMIDSILLELSPTYDALADLYEFFVQAVAQDRREPLRNLRRITVLDARDQLAQLLRDIRTIATPIELIDATLQTTQTRTMLYGVCSVALCIGAFLAHRDDSLVFETATGLNRWSLVYGLVAIAGAILIRMQRQLRNVPKQNQ